MAIKYLVSQTIIACLNVPVPVGGVYIIRNAPL